MRTIAHKGGGGLILAIFVRKYYVDDPYVYIFYAFLNNKKKIHCLIVFTFRDTWQSLIKLFVFQFVTS